MKFILIDQSDIIRRDIIVRLVASQIRDEELLLERREKIIAAAISVFQKKGYHVATTRDVAVEAGVTQSNLYNYIKTKSDILFLVCERLVNLYHEALASVEQTSSDPRSLVVDSLRSIVRIMYDHRRELRLLYNEVHSLDASDRKIVTESVSKLNSRVEELISGYEAEYGPILLENKRLAANILSFTPTVVALRAWDLAPRASRAEQEEGIIAFVLTGLGISPGAKRPRGAKNASGGTEKAIKPRRSR